ncbi:MAG: PD40 domain-containing protein, partial [Geodermatophilaceae bacterium]|nr:PD40 domain-containing protein [Geodermatophilaceae bacterium]
MRPADLALLHTPGAPTLSPDGTTAVVAVTRLDLAENEYRSALWQVATDGATPARQLTQGTKDSEPRYSPDGRWLAFLRAGEGKAQLHVLPTDGGESVRVTDHPLGAGAPVWSPDSTSIAYSARIPETGRYGTDEKLTPDKEAPRLITELAYRIDGLGFHNDRRPHLFVVEVVRDGVPFEKPELVQVTDGEWNDTAPAWSPDGASLAFVSARHERRHVDLAGDLFVCARDGSGLRQLTDSATDPARPVFSPDGRTILYTSPGDLGPDGLDFVANHEGLWSVPTDGSAAPTRLTEAEPDDLSDGMPMTPTADGVLVGRLHRGSIELWLRSWDDGAPTAVLTGPRQVRGHAAAAGVVVATVADAGSAGELVAIA